MSQNLDVKDLGLLQTVSGQDRILMTDAANSHQAKVITIQTFREEVLQPLLDDVSSNKLSLQTLQSVEEYNAIVQKDEKTMYVVVSGGKIIQVCIGRYIFATGAETLGEMENVNGEINDPNDSEETLVLMQRPGEREWIKGVLNTGSATTGASLRLTSLTDNALTSIPGRKEIIGFRYISEYYDDQTDTGPGVGTVTVNGIVVSTQPVQQGENYISVTEWLKSGMNTINIRVANSLGNYRALTYTVNVIKLSLSSTFDDSQVFNAGFQYKFTPLGAIQKTVHFELDGVEIGDMETATTNTQQTFNVPAQSHGSHTFRVYMTAVINGQTVRSNELFYDLIFASANSRVPVIASSFNRTDAMQHEILSIPFMVYTPDNNTSLVALYANDTLISRQTVDKSRQTWNYRLDNPGETTLRIESGQTRKEFTVNVSVSSVQVEAVSDELELYLTSNSRSNNDDNRQEWAWEDVSANLTGFNFATNGWIADADGSMALKVSGDARVYIPFNVFGTDFRTTGKTIEFEFATSDVADYQADIIRCMHNDIGLHITAQEAAFASEQVKVEAKFKEDERIRVSFVVEQRNENRLVYTYINGIMSGVAQYPADDNFQQTTPVGISIGTNSCTVKLYNIRVYGYNLTQLQLVDNYIADMDNFTRKLEVYERNQVYNDYGSLDYSRIVEQVPCMTIIGELPQYKGNKKTVSVIYEDRQSPDKNFTSDNVEIDVQGTSSQFYPRKNYKTKHRGGFQLANGEHSDTFKLRPESIPVNTFCEKADFAESSGTHNTGMARIVDNLLKDMELLTPPQKEDSRVRTTIDGYPVVIFHQETTGSERTFLGKYNLNNDKSTQETFGFSDAAECWEVTNNVSSRVIFQSADFSGTDWQNDFEGRYPDGNTDPENLRTLCEWVVSTNGDPEKFRNECAEHFNVDFLVFYYVVTELFAMVDQRAKNMMLASWGNEGSGAYKWYPIFYDNDTVLGINNEGLIAFSYNAEYTDPLVWNGADSVLWNNVAAAFEKEIADMYYQMRSKGYVSYLVCENMFEQEQAGKWNESVYNMDGRFKYIDPLIENGNGSYLYAAQGSRQDHRKWWLYNRLRYIDSKYHAGDFVDDFIHLRLNTPPEWAGVEPNGDFDITPFADQYARIKYGSYLFGERAWKDQTVHFTAPDMRFTDTETAIYGASRIKSIGELASKYPGSVDISAGVKLSELIVGSGAEGYSNPWMLELNVGNNTLLRKVDIRNCPNLKQPVDLSGCESIEEVYATGTGITSVVLPQAGILSHMELPETITNLTIMNQPNLTDDSFSIGGVENLSTLRIENTAGINVFNLIDRCMSLEKSVLNRVRLVNVEGQGSNMKILLKLAELAGLDENGNNTQQAVVTGKYYVTSTTDYELQRVNEIFPGLTIYYNSIVPAPVTTFVFNSTGNQILEETELIADGYIVERVNDYTFKVAAQEDGDVINYTFRAKNHRPKTGSYTVAGTRTQSYPVTYEALRTIKVKVDGQELYPAARVVIDGLSYDIGENGIIEIRNSNEISIKVISNGYATRGEILPSITNDTLSILTVYLAVPLKLIANDHSFGFGLSGVVFIVKNQNTNEEYTGETNRYGEVTFQVAPRNDFSFYAIYKNTMYPCYNIASKVNGNTGYAEVKIDITDLKPEENGNIQCLFCPYSSSYREAILTLTSPDSHTISWGDGSTEIIPAGDGISIQTICHSYDNASEYYQIEVSDVENITKFNLVTNHMNSNGIVAFWSIGNSKISNLNFTHLGTLRYVGDVFKNDVERTDFTSCFQNCYKLLGVSNNLFSRCTHARTFLYCFRDCYSLESIPDGLFSGCANVTDFHSCFSGCRSLEVIPDKLFSDCTNAQYFIYCFSECASLKSIPDSLFLGCPKTTTISSCFSKCTSLESIPDSLFFDCHNVSSFSRCFSGCESLKYIPTTLFSACPMVSDFSSCFLNCSSLLSIPEDIFSECTEVTNFSHCFSGCSSIIFIPENLFSECTKVTDFSYCFYNCSSLSTIILPDTIISLGNGNYYGCTSLLYIIAKTLVPPTITSTTFNNTNDCPIYVPDEAVDAYKTASNWIALADRIFPISQKTN